MKIEKLWNWKRGLGIGLLFIGVFLAFSGKVLTGAVIGTKPENYLGLLGLLVFIFGVLLLFVAREKEGGLVNIIKTERFKRAIRGHDINAINRAIAKIGTGLGKEEKLKGRSDYSIRESKGGRILFEYNPGHTEATLIDYLPAHQY